MRQEREHDSGGGGEPGASELHAGVGDLGAPGAGPVGAGGADGDRRETRAAARARRKAAHAAERERFLAETAEKSAEEKAQRQAEHAEANERQFAEHRAEQAASRALVGQLRTEQVVPIRKNAEVLLHSEMPAPIVADLTRALAEQGVNAEEIAAVVAAGLKAVKPLMIPNGAGGVEIVQYENGEWGPPLVADHDIRRKYVELVIGAELKQAQIAQQGQTGPPTSPSLPANLSELPTDQLIEVWQETRTVMRRR